MKHIEENLEDLKADILAMAQIVKVQLLKTKKSILEYDLDLARDVLANEKKLNALEQKIDKTCENILALYTPVAIDLRFILASLEINRSLERIGDHLRGSAHLLSSMNSKSNNRSFKEFHLEEMFNTVISMMEDIIESLVNGNTKLARKVFKRDEYLNRKHKKAAKVAVKLIQGNPHEAKFILPQLTVIREIERIGDLVKNIGREIIFHLEAEDFRTDK